jgi:serine/threonine protein kinase
MKHYRNIIALQILNFILFALRSLDRLLYDTNEKLSEKRKIFLIEGIAAGMYHLHKHNIVHRDLAARNILLTSGGDPKISDFGLSRILEQVDEGKTKCKIGPVCWMAPESIGQQVYSKKSDVWMFGILVYEIVVQSKPHSGQNPKRVGALIR